MLTSSYFRIAVIFSGILYLPLAFSQAKPGGGHPTGGGTTPTPGVTSAPRPTINIPNPTEQQQQLIYISGKVLLEEGTPPPEPVAIERVCNGSPHREGYTDSKGNFQIQLGQGGVVQDVTESNNDGYYGSARNNSGPFGSSRGIDQRSLLGCDIRAVLPGFLSSSVPLHAEGNFGPIQVGTLLLKKMGNVQGSTISLTTLQAPGDARHAYEKAQKALAKKKLADAEKQLTKAVQIYPRFAAAWSLLGAIHEQQNQLDQASHDYSQALLADPNFVNPYFGLGVIAARQQKWQETVQFTDQVAKLNPYAFPAAYFYNAAANFNLGNLDAAEKNARKFQSLDTEHRRPEVSLLLGEILSKKRDYAGAAAQEKDYLKVAPNASNAEAVKADVKRLETLSGTGSANASVPPANVPKKP